MSLYARLLLWLLVWPVVAAAEPSVRYLAHQGVVAVDMVTGLTLWRALPHQHTFAPVTAGGRVYVGSTNGLYALDATTGAVLWRRQPGSTIYSPTVDGERLYAGSLDLGVVAFNAVNGQSLWQRWLPGWVYSPALQQGVLVSGGSEQRLWGLDPATGDEQWSHRLDQELVSAPRATRHGVLATTYAGTVVHLGPEGRLLWQVQDPVATLHTVVADERVLLAGWDGSIRIRRLQDGALLNQTALNGRLMQAPLVAHGLVLLISEAGEAGTFSLADLRWARRGAWLAGRDPQPLAYQGDFFGLYPSGTVTNW